MARPLRVQIDGDSKGGRKALDDVADEADKAARTMRDLAGEFKDAARAGNNLRGELEDVGGTAKAAGESVAGLGKRTDKTAEELRDAARAAEKLDVALAATSVEIKRLNKEFADSGDTTVLKTLQKQYSEYDRISKLKVRIARDEEEANRRVVEEAKKATEPIPQAIDPIRQIQKQYAEMDRLARLKKRIADDERAAYKEAAELAEKARSAARQDRRDGRGVLRNTLGDLFGLGKQAVGLGRKGIESGTGLATESVGKVPGAGVIGGALAVGAAPLIGATAGGAVLAGAGALGVGAGIAGAVANNPEPFQKAWAKAIADISNRWKDASTGFEGPALAAFKTISDAVDNIDIEGPFEKAQGFVEPLADGVSGLLEGLGNGFGDLISNAGPVIAVLEKDLPLIGDAFEAAFAKIGDSSGDAAVAFDDVLRFVGLTIVAVGELIADLSSAYVAVRDFGMAIVTLGGNIDIFNNATPTVLVYGRALGGAKQATDDFVSSERYLADAVHAASDELSSQTNALLALDRANDEASVAVDALKEAFKKNGDAITGNSKAAEANRQVLQDTIQTYSDQRDAAIKASDGSVVAIGKANAAYRQHLEELRAILRAHGDDTSAVDRYLAELDRLNGTTVSVNIVTRHIDQFLPQGVSLGALQHHARGGTADRSGWSVVGEHGPEIAWLDRGQYVSTAEQTRDLASRMGGGGGQQQTPPISITVHAGMGTDGYQVGRQVADALREYVGPSGGNLQQIVMRRGG